MGPPWTIHDPSSLHTVLITMIIHTGQASGGTTTVNNLHLNNPYHIRHGDLFGSSETVLEPR